MKTTLVTGGIGSGKSEVCRYLMRRGFPVYDCDSRCKALYDNVPGLKDRIETALGVPFSRIGLIFEDESKREVLESIVFPLLLEDIAAWKSGIGTDRCFIESATALGKKAFEAVYDDVWIVKAEYGARLARNPKVAQRAGLQSFDETRASRIIENNGSLEELYDKVDKII